MQKIHASYIIVFFAIGTIIGAIIVAIVHTAIFSSIIWLFSALVLLLFALISSRRFSTVLALSSGIILILFRASPAFISQDYVSQIIGSTITISGTVSKDPEESNGKYNLKLTNLKQVTGKETVSLSGTLFIQVTTTDLQRSDQVTISGELSAGFGSFLATIYRPEIRSINRPTPGDIFLTIRNFFAEKIKQYIPAPQHGLALGYLLGQKTGVDQTFQETLQLIGLTHIIVASGAHLSTLTSFARKIFGKLSRFASFLVAISATLFFIGITGLSASMLRAGLVSGLSLLLWYFGREIHPLRLIILVAAVTLAYNPFYLTELAWLLSFLSFSAILVVSPALTKFLYGKDRKPSFVSSTLISSFSAAFLTAPVLLYFFGQISFISIFANLLILPTVSIAMGLTFLTGISAIIIPPIAGLIGRITQAVLDYQISVANFFGEQKQFLLAIEPNNAFVFLLYVPPAVVIITTLIYQKRKRQKVPKTT